MSQLVTPHNNAVAINIIVNTFFISLFLFEGVIPCYSKLQAIAMAQQIATIMTVCQAKVEIAKPMGVVGSLNHHGPPMLCVN